MRQDRKKWVDDASVEELIGKLAARPRDAADRETMERATAAYKEARKEARGGKEPGVQEVFVRMMGSRALQGAMAAAVLLLVVAGVCVVCDKGAERLAQNGQDGPAAEIAFIQKLYEMGNVKGLTGVLGSASIEAKIAAAHYLLLVGDQSAVAPLEKASQEWKGDTAANPFAKAAAAIAARGGQPGAAAEANELPAAKVAPSATTVPAEMLPADPNMQTMIVKMVDKATGKSLAGAKVKAIRGEKVVDGTTGKEGTTAISMKQSPKGLRLQVTCTGYVGLYRILKGELARNLPKAYVFELEKGITIGGLVKDAEGQPIEGVNVQVLRFSGDLENAAEKAMPYIWEKLTTDAEGKWTYSGVPRDMANLSVGFQHPRYRETGCDVREVEQANALEAGTLETVLQHGLEIRGIVRRTDGTPVKSADVLRGEQDCGEEYCRTTTDEQGRFMFGNAAEGQEFVTVLAEGCAPESQTVTVANEGVDIEFILGPERTLRGRVVDAGGVPVKGAAVGIGKWRGCRILRNSATSDTEGRFEITGLPSDAMQVRLSRKSMTEKLVENVVADGQDKTFVLAGSVRVRGSVVDARTGQPIANFRLIPGVEWEAGQGIIWQNMAGWVKSYQNGQYDYTFERAGTSYAIKIEADGYLKGESRLLGPDETDIVCDIALVRSSMVEGVVLGPDGKPAAGVTVVIADQWGVAMENGKLQTDDMRLDNGERYPVTKTDPNGRFALTEPNVPYTVIAVGNAGAWGLSADGFRQAGEIKLRAWGRIEGQYFVGTKPAGRRQVKVELAGSHDEAGYITARYNKLTDADGKFVIEKVFPGKMRVEWVPVEVAPGQTTHVTVGGKGRTVTAEMELPAGLKARSASLSFEWYVSPEPRDDWWNSYTANVPWPANVDSMTEAEIREWFKEYGKTPEGRRRAEERQLLYSSQRRHTPRAEGNRVIIEDMEPGTYTLNGAIGLKDSSAQPRNTDSILLGSAQTTFEVPPFQAAELDIPIDLGKVSIQLSVTEGDSAPEVTVDGTGSDKVRLADYRGSVVLLVMHSITDHDDDPGKADFAKIEESFSSREGFTIVGILLESRENPIARARARESRPNWKQGFAGAERETLVRNFGILFSPRLVLIDRDGRIVTNGLRGQELISKIEEALAK